MKRMLVLAMALATTLSAVGCSDSTGPAGSLAGTYTLQSVNGSPVPMTIAPGLDVLSGAIVLDVQGNYTGTIRYRDSFSAGQPVYDDTIYGYWTLTGNQLTLVDTQTNTQYFATISGNTLTLSNGSDTEVYTK